MDGPTLPKPVEREKFGKVSWRSERLPLPAIERGLEVLGPLDSVFGEGGAERGRWGRLCTGIGEEDVGVLAMIASTASSEKSGVVWASMSAFEGSTRKRVGSSVDRRRLQYDRKR